MQTLKHLANVRSIWWALRGFLAAKQQELACLVAQGVVSVAGFARGILIGHLVFMPSVANE